MARSELGMEAIDTGSNYKFGDKMISANVPKSAFDLTRLSSFDIENAGIVFPLGRVIETVPGDDFDLSVTSLLRYMPQVVPLYSRQRLYIYAFYSRCSDLWCHWETFMKKGMNGNKILEIPTLNTENTPRGLGNVQNNSIHEMLGIPQGITEDNLYKFKINAMPFMMYTRIWRDYFLNPNTLTSLEQYNEAIFPDDDDDFRLQDDGTIKSIKNNNMYLNWMHTSSSTWTDRKTKNGVNFTHGTETEIQDPTEAKGNIWFGNFFHTWADDRFTDALPFPQRGDTPELKYNLFANATKAATLGLWNNGTQVAQGNMLTGQSLPTNYGGLALNTTDASAGNASHLRGDMFMFFNPSTSDPSTSIAYNPKTGDVLGVSLDEGLAQQLNLKISMNDIRELAIAQTELEKMARTDGSYLQFNLTFFDEIPKNSKNYKPTFIGGTYTDIHFTEVLQTGQDTQESPLGSYAGHGIGGTENDYIGHVHCDDYGYIMLLGCICPDTYYHQGIPKELTRHLQSDFYLPERAKMGMIPILNKEIYAFGTDEENEGLFGYTNPFDEMRYMPNEIHGQLANPESESFYPYTQARYFTEKPNWNYNFTTMRSIPNKPVDEQPSGGVRKDYLAAPTESMCTAQFKIQCRGVRPLPYKAIPANLGI